MKRFLLLLVTLLPFFAYAQVENVLDIVSADRDKLSGCEGPYRFDAPALTPAPKGYVPFYISHYGRHGSRYAWNAKTYTDVKQVLDVAEKAGALTELGKQIRQDFLDFWFIPWVNTGDLVELGWDQHTEIARTMAADFPEVFSAGGTVLARSSTSPRAIVSMNAFTVSLQKAAPKVSIAASAFHTELSSTIPVSAPKAIRPVYSGEVRLPEPSLDFFARTVDADAIIDRLISDRTLFEEEGGKTNFVWQLYRLWGGYHNYCDSDFLEDVFTPEAALALWEAENYDLYCQHSGDRYQNISLLEDILVRAAGAIDGSGTVADLRFGHDTCFNAIRPLLNINGCGFEPETADEVKYWFQDYDTPMAANLQFVLYRPKKGDGPVLFKLLLNGAEATLPQLEPADGPYYLWDDFTAWADMLLANHPIAAK